MQQGGMNEVEKEYLDFEDDNPLLSKVIERNIRTIISEYSAIWLMHCHPM